MRCLCLRDQGCELYLEMVIVAVRLGHWRSMRGITRKKGALIERVQSKNG